MPDGIQYRLELAQDENRALREQLADVQRTFEHHVLDGDTGALATPIQSAPPHRASADVSPRPSGLVRLFRHRLAAPRSAAGNGLATLRGAGPTARPGRITIQRERARLRAEAALAEEKARQSGLRLARAESRLAGLEAERARSGQVCAHESECVAKFSAALEASQKLLQQLGGLMEKRLAEADERETAIRERLGCAEERLSAERVERASAEQAARVESERLRELREQLEQQIALHRAADRARQEASDELLRLRDEQRTAEQARNEAEAELTRIRQRLERAETELASVREARRQEVQELGRLRERLQRIEGELESERGARAAAERVREETDNSLVDVRQRLEQAEAALGSERDAREAAERSRQDEADARAQLQERLQRIEPALESEREARRAAEQGRILDAENLDEMRRRFAEQRDRLATRDRLIGELAGHIDAAWTSVQRLVDEDDLSPAVLAELIQELRDGADALAADDA